MAAATVRITGLKETVRAFNKIDKGLIRNVQKGLKRAAEPVAVSARAKVSQYRGASVGTISPRARGASAFVTQRARKVTGKRGDFGALQMRRLVEALDENREEVVRAVERELDDLLNDF